MTTREEFEAWDRAKRRFLTSPEVQAGIEAHRTRAELERARRASQRRRNVLLALEILAGAFVAAFTLACAVKITLMLAR